MVDPVKKPKNARLVAVEKKTCQGFVTYGQRPGSSMGGVDRVDLDLVIQRGGEILSHIDAGDNVLLLIDDRGGVVPASVDDEPL